MRKSKLPGTWQVSERMRNAEENFVEVLRGKGFTRDEAVRAMRTMLKLRVAKLDPVLGRISVTHGAFLDSDAIRKAVNYAGKVNARRKK
jgi:hypothetical protein